MNDVVDFLENRVRRTDRVVYRLLGSAEPGCLLPVADVGCFSRGTPFKLLLLALLLYINGRVFLGDAARFFSRGCCFDLTRS